LTTHQAVWITRREKYFDYFVINIVDCGFPRSGARRRVLVQTISNAQGSISTRSGVRKITLETCDFVDISNAMIPTTLGGSTTASPPIVIVILREQLDYVIVDYAASTMPHSIKAKFSSSKSQFLFTFCRTRHSGATP
jgi:hypothetical protein